MRGWVKRVSKLTKNSLNPSQDQLRQSVVSEILGDRKSEYVLQITHLSNYHNFCTFLTHYKKTQDKYKQYYNQCYNQIKEKQRKKVIQIKNKHNIYKQ